MFTSFIIEEGSSNFFKLKQLRPLLCISLHNFSFMFEYIFFRDTSQRLSVQLEFYFNNFKFLQSTLIIILLYFSSMAILKVYIMLRSILSKLEINK